MIYRIEMEWHGCWIELPVVASDFEIAHRYVSEWREKHDQRGPSPFRVKRGTSVPAPEAGRG